MTTANSLSSIKALVALFAISTSAIAEVSPEQAERFTHIAGFNLADLPSFEALANVFGPSPVAQSGDASTSDYRVCYRSLDGSRTVEFFHGEVQWGFTISTQTEALGKCPASAALTPEVATIAGVTLGMTKKEYEATVGRPTEATAQHVHHHVGYVRVLSDKEIAEALEELRKKGHNDIDPESWRSWDVGITLDGAFRNGRLVSFTVTRVATN
jgi:hypothetical protein